MEEHIIDAEKAGKLEDESRYQYLSKEELLADIKAHETVIEIGSGTGFYTDHIAKTAEQVYAVDFQEKMHEFYREKGLPENVELVNSEASEIHIEESDSVVSIFSFHEIDVEKALKKFSKILDDRGKLVIYDWSSEAADEEGPPLDKRYNAEKAANIIGEHFDVLRSVERRDTFKVVGEVSQDSR